MALAPSLETGCIFSSIERYQARLLPMSSRLQLQECQDALKEIHQTKSFPLETNRKSETLRSRSTERPTELTRDRWRRGRSDHRWGSRSGARRHRRRPASSSSAGGANTRTTVRTYYGDEWSGTFDARTYTKDVCPATLPVPRRTSMTVTSPSPPFSERPRSVGSWTKVTTTGLGMILVAVGRRRG